MAIWICMCTVCLLLFHAYSSYWFPLSPTANRQEKLVAMVDRKVKKGEFRPSGSRSRGCFQFCAREVCNSRICHPYLIKKLKRPRTCGLTKCYIWCTRSSLEQQKMEHTPTTPHFWQVMNSAKPSVDAAYHQAR